MTSVIEPKLIQGDARDLHMIADETVDLIVTSPPYFGLRSYQDNGEHYDTQIGAEATPQEFIAALIECTREMVRVLKPSGSIFVNLGDKYGPNKGLRFLPERYRIACSDELGLIGRAVIIWDKPDPIPSGMQKPDRVGYSHEDWVHLVRSRRYFATLDPIRVPIEFPGQSRTTGKAQAAVAHLTNPTKQAGLRASRENPLGKIPGSVWRIATAKFRPPAELGVDHFASFPMEFPRRLILGWSPPGGVVLDPFGGTGTTALVAAMHGRHGISVDASQDYCRLAEWRVNDPKQRERASRAAGTKPAKAVSTPMKEAA